MKKIVIVGTTASGKSTLATKLAQKLNYSYVQLDVLFWGPNWTESNDEVFFERVRLATSDDCWIVDGNYARTNHLTWGQADTVIWIDLPFWLNLYQSLTRAFKRSFTREELWPGTNNRETFQKLFSKDSIVKWLFLTYESNRKKYLERMGDPQYSHIKFIHLKSRRDIEDFLNKE